MPHDYNFKDLPALIQPSTMLPEVTSPDDFARQFIAKARFPEDEWELVAEIAASSLHGVESKVHGYRHWLKVLANALDIRRNTPVIQTHAVESVLLLFALFHDIAREHDGRCLEHGYAGSLRLIQCSQGKDAVGRWIRARFGPECVAIASAACQMHTICDVPRSSPLLRFGEAPSPIRGLMSPVESGAIGACLDADRCDLLRVGQMPDAFFLYTDYARMTVANAEV